MILLVLIMLHSSHDERCSFWTQGEPFFFFGWNLSIIFIIIKKKIIHCSYSNMLASSIFISDWCKVIFFFLTCNWYSIIKDIIIKAITFIIFFSLINVLKTILLNKALSEKKKIKLQINTYLGDVHLTSRDILKSN